jgi:hypothetical protein
MYFDVVAYVEEQEEEEREQGVDTSRSAGGSGRRRAAASTGSLLRLGVVLEEPSSSSSSSSTSITTVTVAPLRKSSDWADSALWVEDESAGAPRRVALPRVRAVLGGASLSQRQDTESNPHGEHAHDVWELPLTGVELPDWVGGQQEQEVHRAVAALLLPSSSAEGG